MENFIFLLIVFSVLALGMLIVVVVDFFVFVITGFSISKWIEKKFLKFDDEL